MGEAMPDSTDKFIGRCEMQLAERRAERDRLNADIALLEATILVELAREKRQ